MTSRLTSRTFVLATVVLAVLLGGGSAAAAWLVAGTGAGAAQARSLVAPNVTATKSTTAPTTTVNVSWTAPSQLSGVTYSVTRNGTTWASCTASPCTDSGLTPGTQYDYVVTAALGGWRTIGTASAATDTAQRATNTTLSSSQNPVRSNSNVTFTATVAPASGTGTPTGTVTFKDGSTTLCSGQSMINGSATCQTSFATFGAPHSLTAEYSGAGTFQASTGTLTQRVVNGGVTGLALSGFKVNGTAVTPTCSGVGTNSYSCSAGSAGNNAVLTVDSATFVSQAGSATVFATDAPTQLSWAATGKGTPTSGSFTIAMNATNGAVGASATKNGSNGVTITVTLTEGGATLTATVSLS